MFSNPIKRLSESLAQAQEQARQQLQKSQRPADAKSLANAENGGGVLIDEEKGHSKHSSEEAGARNSEETNVVTAEKTDNNLPKEVRIKLAKLAKYEDRHPSISLDYNHFNNCVELQAAYKESQGRITTFEKVLRERTPLGSIDEVEDFRNYLNTLSVRTNVNSKFKVLTHEQMSLEELKRVTEVHERTSRRQLLLNLRFKTGTD
jgi:5'-3' exonuclease